MDEMPPLKMMYDERLIKALYYPSGEPMYKCMDPNPWGVGLFMPCDKIIAYEENGEMAPHVWFAVFRLSEIISRVNSSHVGRVEWEPDEDEVPF